jgi:glucoamylase
VAFDAGNASAVRTAPALRRTSSGYAGTSDGWTDLRADHRMDWAYDATKPGNVVQLGSTELTGVGRGCD